MEISETVRTFVLHWGEMGSRWGINRVTAQIHALLLASDKPLHAQEICEALGFARSNISTGLRELQSWGIIRLIHVLGDRREHFEADKDVWEVLAKIADRRIEREIIPTIALLESLQSKRGVPSHLSKLFQDFVDIFQSGVSFYRRVRGFPVPIVKRLLRLDRKIERVLSPRHVS